MRAASFRRTAAALLLIAAFAAPLASAAAPRNEISDVAGAVSLSPLEFLGRLWSFLRSVLSMDKPGSPSPPPATTKDSCGIDPSGQCKPGKPSPPPVQTKEGCKIDPNGLCVP